MWDELGSCWRRSAREETLMKAELSSVRNVLD
jgi:hypothetical protein